MFVDASEENADMDTWKIHSFNTIPFPFPFPSKYSLVGCHGDGGTVSRNNVRTTILLLLYCAVLYFTIDRNTAASVDRNIRKRLRNLEGNQINCAISSRIRMK